jgi:glutathione S-transferase
MSLTLYTNPMSRGRIARWMLEEVGQPYDTVVLDYGTTMKGAEFLALNPMGKVPTITHNSVVVTECAAICAYLADAFPEANLAPPPLQRAAYYRWLFFAAGPIEQATTGHALGVIVPDEKRAMVGFGSLGQVVDVLEARLKQSPYFAGDAFTAADVYAGSQVIWGTQFGTIENRPVFQEYAARLTSRPAAIRAVEIDDALMAAASTGG